MAQLTQGEYESNPLYLRPGETTEAYQSRTKALQSGSSVGSGNSGVETSDDTSNLANKILGEVSNRLFSESGAVSSDETTSAYNDIIERVKESQSASETALKSELERAKIGVEEEGTDLLTSSREAARGLGAASSFSLIDRIEKSTEKSLRDLDLRYQEALASGQSDTANKLSELQLKILENKQTQQQQAFQNILSLGSFALSVQDSERAAATVKREETNQVRSLALTYPSAFSGKDIDSMSFEEAYSTARSSASEAEKIQLDYQRAQIASLNRSTSNSPEITASNYDKAKSEAVMRFNDIVSSGGTVNKDTYLEFRSLVPATMLENFDNDVGRLFLSEDELKKAGITPIPLALSMPATGLDSIANEMVKQRGIDAARSLISLGKGVQNFGTEEEPDYVTVDLKKDDQTYLLKKINELPESEPEEKENQFFNNAKDFFFRFIADQIF